MFLFHVHVPFDDSTTNDSTINDSTIIDQESVSYQSSDDESTIIDDNLPIAVRKPARIMKQPDRLGIASSFSSQSPLDLIWKHITIYR